MAETPTINQDHKPTTTNPQNYETPQPKHHHNNQKLKRPQDPSFLINPNEQTRREPREPIPYNQPKRKQQTPKRLAHPHTSINLKIPNLPTKTQKTRPKKKTRHPTQQQQKKRTQPPRNHHPRPKKGKDNKNNQPQTQTTTHQKKTTTATS